MSKLPLIFMGSPEVAVTILKSLYEAGHEIRAVVTQPDKPAGRGQKLTPPPVKVYAESKNLKIFQPLSPKDTNFIQSLQELQAKTIIVAAYGRILPNEILNLTPFKCINVHFSLLPQYRGASCVASAILNGDRETGVTLMEVVQKLDAGPIYKQEKITISESDTTATLEDHLAQRGSILLLKLLEELQQGPVHTTLQDESQTTYAPLLKKEQASIDWNQEAKKINQQIRAFLPWPVATTQLDGLKIKVFAAEVISGNFEKPAGSILQLDESGILVACGKDALLIKALQPESKKRMNALDFIRGQQQKIHVGKVFS